MSVVPAESLIHPDVFDRVRVIKVDVEGYEVEALAGLERIVARGAPLAIFVELSPRWSGAGSEWVEALCEKHGLEPWLIENEYSLSGYFPRVHGPR